MALSQIWTLVSGQTERTLADWGVSSAVITRRTQRPDALTIKIGNTRFDDAELFAYQSQITLKRAGTPWFVGVATKTPRMGRPNAEGMGYSFEGPWWFFEHVVYQQGWSFLNSVSYRPDWQYYGIGGSGITNDNISSLILAMDDAGVPISTGAQITDAINFAIAAGAPLQIGTIDPNLVVPSEAARDITCAEVIRRMLRWHPDCVTWIDYSFTPPKINIRQRANLTAASFAVAGKPASGLDIAARPDLVPPVVSIKYEIRTSLDDQDSRTLVTDKYPAVAEAQPGAIVMTIDLQGVKTTYVKQYIKTEELDADDLAWWKERLPWLNDAKITNLALVGASSAVAAILDDGGDQAVTAADKGNGSTSGGTVYGFNIVQGEIPNWLTGNAQMVLAQVKVNYDVDMGTDGNGNAITEHHANEVIFAKVMSTDLATGWFTQLSGVYAGEPVPTGVAQAYYTALAQLQYEGSWEITEEECGGVGGPYLGKVLNLTGGLAAWTSMNAAISEAAEDLATGKTRLHFGPIGYLSPKDWITWLRVNRWREIGDRAARVNGLLTTGSHPVGGTGGHDRGGAGSKGPPKHVATVGAHKVTIQPTIVNGTIPSDLNVQLRRCQVCDPDTGEIKTVLQLQSEMFTP